MKPLSNLLLLVPAITLGFVSIAQAGELAHEHHEAVATQLHSSEHGGWQTDAPLRRGMSGIRDAVSVALPMVRQGTLRAADVGVLAAVIDENVEFMIANCKLAPQADATLHALLGEIIVGKASLQQNPNDLEGMSRIMKALADYPDYFEHQGWEPLGVSVVP